MKIVFADILFVVGSIVAGGVLLGISITLEDFSWKSLALGLVAGATLRAVGSLAWRYANLSTLTLGINSISYLTPLVALGGLSITDQLLKIESANIIVAHWDWLLIGACAIVLANITLNGIDEIGPAFQATLVMLWASFTFVYLRDERFIWVGTDYWGFFGLVATILALMLAFRMSRVISINSEEERNFFKIVQSADLLWRQRLLYVYPDTSDKKAQQVYQDLMEKIHAGSNWTETWKNFPKPLSIASLRALRKRLSRIDAPDSRQQLQEAYNDISIPLWEARIRSDITSEDRDKIAAFDADLTHFINSKRHEWDFGEYFVIVLLTIATLALALLAFPPVDGLAGLLTDAVSAFICAAFMFLVFNLWELQQTRQHPWLKELSTSTPTRAEHTEYPWPDRRDYALNFDARDHSVAGSRSARLIASIMVLVLTGIYVFLLLWPKWLG